MTVSTSIAAIMPTATHIATAEAQGSNPAVYLEMIAQNVSDLIQHLVQFQNTMPAGDANIAAVAAIIASLE